MAVFETLIDHLLEASLIEQDRPLGSPVLGYERCLVSKRVASASRAITVRRIVLDNLLSERDVLVAPKQLINCRRERKQINLLNVELDAERVRNDSSLISQHRVEQLVVFETHSLVEPIISQVKLVTNKL